MKMLKTVFAAALLSGISGIASAEAWIVDVTLSYVNRKVELVENVPVLSFTVPVGQCVHGVIRTEDMIPKPMKVRQEICVAKSGNRIQINGWLLAKDRITDLAFKGERGQFNYGQPVNFEIDGEFLRFSSGHYTITATRTMSM